MSALDPDSGPSDLHGRAAEGWMRRANCRAVDPAAFFPSDIRGLDAARRLCGGCSVKTDCLEYALNNRLDHGVWGGTSERERQRMLRQQRVSKRTPS